MPIVVSFPFLAVLLAMSYELSRDVLRAAQLGRELRESEERMSLASEAAGFGVWVWSVAGNQAWGSERWLRLFGFERDATVTFENINQRIHPDDREGVERAVRRAVADRGDYAAEYRVVLPDNTQRWVAARGRVYPDTQGKPVRMMGATIDITARKQAEAETLRQRAELAHVARVSTMGELAASVAHELNQPLGAILANAEAADLFLNQDPPALDELRAILVDIRQDDERASEVIRRMRALLRKHELERLPLEINSVVEDVLQVVSGDAALRKIAIGAELAPGLPKILGDRVHLQQVLLNLILNGMDAMVGEPRERRRLSIRTRSSADSLVELAVMDSGHGIAPEMLPRLFEAFYITKPNGMGMGLSISRTIIEAHHGRISAENNASGGATFRVMLPVSGEGQVKWKYPLAARV
jgi:PAS domain S-box-containing protein